MRVLVAGGAGFIGQSLVRRLLQLNNEVVVVDNFSTGTRDLAQALGHPGALMVAEHDVRQPFRHHLAFDLVVNLACPASPPHYQRDPVGTMMTNVLGTKNLLDLAQRHGARFLQASTSEVYGDPTVHPQPEPYKGAVSCTGPRACYDEGKRSAESLCFDYRRTLGASVRVARIFNTYGPGMHPDDGRVVSNFIVQALKDEPLTVYGDGRQTRSFCYVSDLVDGLLRLVAHGDEQVGPVNLGNPSEFTVLEAAKMVGWVTGKTITIDHRPLPADDPRQRRPDISLAKQLLDWKPRVAFEDGLAKTAAYFRDTLKV